MSKSKAWIIAATVLTVAGLVIFAAAFFAMEGNLEMLNMNKYETNTHEVTDDFNNISFDTDTANISLALSEDGSCKVVCHEEENAKHLVCVNDGTLSVNSVKKKWYEYIGISFGEIRITVYLPKAKYDSISIKDSTGNVEIPEGFEFGKAEIELSTGNVKCSADVSDSLKIKTDTGKICLTGLTAGDVALTVSTGKTEIRDLKCRNLSSEGDTGRITLESVIAQEGLFIERSTGDVSLQGCDASEIKIETDTGDVRGTLLSEKIFFTDTSTGDVDVPKTASGGRCEIKTSTGNIKIKIAE